MWRSFFLFLFLIPFASGASGRPRFRRFLGISHIFLTFLQIVSTGDNLREMSSPVLKRVFLQMTIGLSGIVQAKKKSRRR